MNIDMGYFFLLPFSILTLMLWLLSEVCLRKEAYDIKRKTTALLFIVTMLLTFNAVMLNTISTETGYSVAFAIAVAWGVDHFYFDPRVLNGITLKHARDISEYLQGEKVQNDGEKDTPKE